MSGRANISVDQGTKERFDKFWRVNADAIFQKRGNTSRIDGLNVLLDFWDENHEESK